MIAAPSRSDVIAGGHRLSYLHAGEPGQPVVLMLHGLASDASTWDRAVGLLAEHGYRVIALDLIGHGFSDKPERSYLLDDFADSVRDFLDVLDIGKATLCGPSLGGAIAMEFSHR